MPDENQLNPGEVPSPGQIVPFEPPTDVTKSSKQALEFWRNLMWTVNRALDELLATANRQVKNKEVSAKSSQSFHSSLKEIRGSLSKYYKNHRKEGRQMRKELSQLRKVVETLQSSLNNAKNSRQSRKRKSR